MDKNGSNYFCHILGRDFLCNVMLHYFVSTSSVHASRSYLMSNCTMQSSIIVLQCQFLSKCEPCSASVNIVLPDRRGSLEGLQTDKRISAFLHSHEGQRFAARLLLTSNDRSPKFHGIPKDKSDKAE